MRQVLAASSLAVLMLCVPWSGAAIVVALVGASCHLLYALAQLVVAVPGLVVAARAGLGGLGAAAGDHLNRGHHFKRLALAVGCFAVWLLVAVVPDAGC